MIKHILYYISICFLAIILMALCGCTNLAKKSTDIAISDLNAIQQQIEHLEHNLPPECKKLLYSDLNRIKSDLDNAKKSVNQILDSCNSEKAVLKSDNRLKGLLILVLIAICSFLCYTTIKRGS